MPAIQLYTVRDRLRADIDATLAELAEMGFQEVEAFDLLEFAAQLEAALPRAGLRAVSTHAGFLDDPEPVLEAAGALGIPLVIHPWTEPERWTTADDIHAIAAGLNAAARHASAVGIRVGYHNHHFELASRIGGRHALEVLVDDLAPDVVLEVDVYWAYAGGADVPALLGRLGDRVVALHLKDGDGSLDTSHQVAVGRGVVPIRECLDAAPQAIGVVELDDTSGDLLTAIRDSRTYVVALERA